VRDQVEAGGITSERYRTYLNLLNEVEAMEEDAQRRLWKK